MYKNVLEVFNPALGGPLVGFPSKRDANLFYSHRKAFWSRLDLNIAVELASRSRVKDLGAT